MKSPLLTIAKQFCRLTREFAAAVSVVTAGRPRHTRAREANGILPHGGPPSGCLSGSVPEKTAGPSARTCVRLHSSLCLCGLCGDVQGHHGAMQRYSPTTSLTFHVTSLEFFLEEQPHHQIPQVTVLRSGGLGEILSIVLSQRYCLFGS